MRKTINLRNPIKINGVDVSEIVVDTNEITGMLYAEADTRRRVAAGAKNITIVPTAEFDFALHPYIGFAAAIAANPAYTFEDMERVHGADVLAFCEVGRNFLLKSEESEGNKSDEQPETTAAPPM